MATPEETRKAAMAELAKRELQRRTVPAAEASAAAATGGAGTGQPLRAEITPAQWAFVDKIARGGTPPPSAIPPNTSWFGTTADIPATLKAAGIGAGIGLGETSAFLGGAAGSAEAGIRGALGFPTETVLPTIEGFRQALGLPEMRAAQNLETLPRAGRIFARAVEGAAGGLPFTGAIRGGALAAQSADFALNEAMQLLISNPKAVMKAGALIDAGAASAGEVAAQLRGDSSPDAQEAARAFTTLITAFGGPKVLNAIREMGMAAKDAFIPKPIARVEQGVGSELAAIRTRQPDLIQTAQENAQAFRDYGMQPPPMGALTGNVSLQAEQAAALRNIPGMAQSEAVRQAATDEAIRNQIAGAGPQGSPTNLAAGVEQRLSAEQQAIEARRQQLIAEIKASEEAAASSKSALEAMRTAFGGMDADEAVRQLVSDAEERAVATLGQLGEGTSALKAGEVFIDQLKKSRTLFRAIANNAYESFLRGTDNIRVATDRIRKAAANAALPTNPLSAKTEEAALPKIIRDIRENDGIAMLNPRQLQGLRSQVAGELRAAEQGPTANADNARRLNIVLDAIDDEFDNLEDQIKGLNVLNQWYREGKTALYSGLVRDAGRDLGSKGGTALNPSELAARYLKQNTAPGAEEVMDQFSRTWGGQTGIEPHGGLTSGVPDRVPSALAERALDEYIIGQMRLEVVDQLTGQVNRSKLVDWIEKHQLALEHRPELNAKLKTVAGAQRLADNQIEQVRAMRKELEDAIRNGATREANNLKDRLKDEDKLFSAATRQREKLGLVLEDPQGAVAEIARKSPERAGFEYRKLRRLVAGDTEAEAGLDKAMWDALTGNFVSPDPGLAGANPLINPDGFAKLLAEKGPLIESIFGKDRRELLTEMQKLAARNLAPNQAVPSVAKPGESQRVKDFFSAMISRAWGIQRGVVGVPYVATELAFRALLGNKTSTINQQQAQRVLEKALYDPEFYDSLIKLAKFPRNKRIARVLATNLSTTRLGTEMLLDNRALRTRQDLKAKYQAEGRL